MTNTCYAMVRGSAIRVTALGRVGQLSDPIRFATSKSVATVRIDEVSESGGNEMIRNEEDERRMLFVSSGQTIRHTADIDFLRCDPGILSIVAGVPLRMNAAGTIVGFDSDTKRAASSFALEVWSLLDQRCADGSRQYGYTLFPFLKGGTLTGFSFDKGGAVTFNLRRAQTRRVSRWYVGPYDLEGPHQRLTEVVSRNSSFKQMITTAAPPVQMDGVQETTDIIDGGNASFTTADVIDGGDASGAGPWIISGGRAL